MTRWAALLAALCLASCGHRAPAPSTASVHYTVGAPYEAGGIWRYPRESFDYEATGLAERQPQAGRTADGEIADPTALTGAHPTLQLPAVATVTNLENGRQLRIRLNDRGPANPGRLLGLSPRAADLLGVSATGAARVRLAVDSTPSQALRDRLQGGPRGITAAPRAAVTAEALPGSPPPLRVVAAPAASSAPDDVPDRLPEQVTQTVPQPGQLWLQAGRFSLERYANARKSKLSPLPVQLRRERASRSPRWEVMAGPFATVAEADAALDQARAAGVTDATIVVE